MPPTPNSTVFSYSSLFLSFLGHLPFALLFPLSPLPHSASARHTQTFLLIRADIGRQPPPVQALCKGTSTLSFFLNSNFVLCVACHSPCLPCDWPRLYYLHSHPDIQKTPPLTTSCLITGSHAPSTPRSLLANYLFYLELLSVQQALNDITALLILAVYYEFITLCIIGRRNTTYEYGEGRSFKST